MQKKIFFVVIFIFLQKKTDSPAFFRLFTARVNLPGFPNFEVTEIWVGNFVGLKKNLGRKYLGVKKKLDRKIFWVKKIWVANSFGSKKNGVGNFLGQKQFVSEIFWGKKNRVGNSFLVF